MFLQLVSKIIGSQNDRVIKKHLKTVDKINALEPEIEKLSDEQLRSKTDLFRKRIENGEKLDDIMLEAFAVVREAAKRTLGQRHYDVQMVGGITLHQGNITEMRTGEGKTLVATLPVYLNALSGKPVHLITINDYLAERDSKWMGQVYEFLGLTVGCIVHGMDDQQRQEAYACDVTYATNNEIGFDYLRDNMKFRRDEMVMRGFGYGIVDEVDSILIDEARTPLIISGPAEDSSAFYAKMNNVIPFLKEEHYEKDEKSRSITLTDAGVEEIERILMEQELIVGSGLYDPQNISAVHHVNQALKAHKMFQRDVDYVVKDGEVIIIDEFTGRMMEGRRYSEGLHQAIEAKEGVEIQVENQTLASITYQNLFRMYDTLAGMTGTAATESEEFEEIYKLHVIEVPTNKPIARIDHDDEVYLTAQEKYDAVLKQIAECAKRKQPLLIGTTSIEKSEYISQLLKKAKIKHQVLNARYHEQESLIIADAGCPGAVTIATNMAGRGTDIKLGGNLEMRVAREAGNMPDGPEKDKKIEKIKEQIEADAEIVKQAGGLYVIGTERHESRRIDNQLRGRSGRQGDPGASKFYVSLEDDLMRIFGSSNLQNTLRRLGAEQGEAISHKMINRALAKAQQKVEGRNFDVRKHLLRFDDVMNDQRKVIYQQRLDLMEADDIKENVDEMRQDVLESLVTSKVPHGSFIEQWDLGGLHEECLRIFGLDLPVQEWGKEEGVGDAEILKKIKAEVDKLMQEKEQQYGDKLLRPAEKLMFLRILDQVWKEHLLALDHLRQGINLRAYAQSNPLHEYKREAYMMFEQMLDRMRTELIRVMAHFEMDIPEGVDLEDLLAPEEQQEEEWDGTFDLTQEHVYKPNIIMDIPMIDYLHKTGVKTEEDNAKPVPAPSRNGPCPCGSGKKFKHCHGALE